MRRLPMLTDSATGRTDGAASVSAPFQASDIREIKSITGTGMLGPRTRSAAKRALDAEQLRLDGEERESKRRSSEEMFLKIKAFLEAAKRPLYAIAICFSTDSFAKLFPRAWLDYPLV